MVEAAHVLSTARSVVVFTGAGVSAESGVPTYRSGADGLWSAQNMERFANPRGYRANLPDSYAWYRARAEGVRAVEPNPAHLAIAELAILVPALTLVTQNIDNLHQRAGSKDVIELHGHLRTARCEGCAERVDWLAAPAEPRCSSCGGMLRPEVVMFEELLPEQEVAAAMEAAKACDLLISVGTSNQVFPAAEIPLIALAGGATVVIINPDMEGQPTHARVIQLPGPAGEVLPQLVDLSWPARPQPGSKTGTT
ncbi:MAG: NAD-dependent deacylase [Gemmatimonadetes bacterium]|nr:NAD-dependent deacylase [Gemmatimonadota bacterium]